MTSFILDKNKSAQKLKGIPHIYWINLDDKEDRAKYMEEQFTYWEIENHTRISAYDGREDDLSDILSGRYPDNMSSGAKGIAFRLVEELGLIRRNKIESEIKILDQKSRQELRKMGVKFGKFSIFFPATVKPKATELLISLWINYAGYQPSTEPSLVSR